MRLSSTLKGIRGLTLVEVLVMIVLVSLVLIAIPASLRSGTQVWEKGNRHNEVLQNALIGMEEITRELRQAKSIRSVSNSTNPHGYIDFEYADGAGNMYQRYEYNGTENYLQYAWSNNVDTDLTSILNPLAGPISGLTFTCYRDQLQVATIPDEIDQIREIHIKMITCDSEGKVNPIPLSARVYLRSWIQHRVSDEFAIFGDNGVGLGDQPLYVGYNIEPSNVGANADINVGQHTTVNGELHHGAGGRLIKQETDVNLGPDYGYDEFILMPCVTNFDDSQWWDGQPVPPRAGQDIKLKNSAKDALDPGHYGTLTLGNNAELSLVAGTYRFDSIIGNNDVSLKVDVTEGDIRVFVDGQVIFGNILDATTSLMDLVEGGGAEHVYFETHYGLLAEETEAAWAMGNNSIWYGAIYAPYGDIDVTDGIINGQLISGGTVIVHGGNPSVIPTPVNATMIDFVRSNFIYEYGYDCLE